MKSQSAMAVAIVGAAVLTACVGFPQIPHYNVYDVNSEVFEELDNVETAKQGSKYLKSKVALSVSRSPKDPKEENEVEVTLTKADPKLLDDGNGETKYVKVQEKIVEGELSPADVASNIAFEILDEVGDHLGSRGSALKKMEMLLERARG